MSNSNEKRRDARLLEALDYLDLEYIDDVIDIMKLPPASSSPEPNRKNTIHSVKLIIALAAAFLLISSFIPILSYIIRNYFISPGGIETTAEEESTAETDAPETTATELVQSGDFGYRVLEDGTLSVYYTGKAEEIVVPAEIDGKKVTAIAANAFVTAADTVKKITLPETIEQIGEQAFANCTLLSEINLPDSLTSIGVLAFNHCNSLKHIRIPAHAFDGGFDEAFAYSGLETVELAEGIEKIPFYTFYKSDLKEITLPISLREIGAYAFLECHYLKTVKLNDGLEKIGDFAFMNICAEEITISASVSTIGKGAFMSCWQMKKITVDQANKIFYSSGNCIINRNTKTLVIGYGECTIPSDGSVTSIGDAAMGGTPIVELTVPDTVTAIGDGAFSLCTRLKSVSLPVTLKSIGAGAFGECTSLESIDLHYGIEFIGEDAFAQCENLAEIYLPDSLTEIGQRAFYDCSSLEKVTLPTGITVIPEDLFRACSSLERVTVGFRTASIGAYAFADCPKLTKFIFSGTAIEWYAVKTERNWNSSSAFDSVQCINGTVPLIAEQSDNGTPGLVYMLNTDGKSAALVSVGSCTETDIVIASLYNGYPVTVIASDVFQGMSELKSVQIPDTVTEIGFAAFSYCTSLTSIRIPESVTTIGSYAFSMCTSLSEIDLPASLTTINRGAFTSTPITSIELGDSLTSVDAELFMNCKNLKSIILPRSITTIYVRAFQSCTALTSVTFEGTVAQWKAVYKEKTWSENAGFTVVHCSDGDIDTATMSADEAIKAAMAYWKLDESQTSSVWIKREPSAAAQRFMVSQNGITENGEIGIIAEVYVDIYTGKVSDVVYDFSDMPKPLGEVILNKRKFVDRDGEEFYLKDYVCG